MNYSDTRFTLDVQLHQAQVSVSATLNDTARRLCVGFTDGRKPYVIAEGCTATFAAKKPDGLALFNACTVENNTIIYEFTPQTTNVIGTYECEIRLYNEDGKQLTSPRFLLVVDEQAINDDDVIDSFTEVTMLNQIIANESERIVKENERITAEEKREQQEIARMNYEASRGSNEITRQDNEETRKTNEETRISNESTRQGSEEIRQANESERIVKENERITAEEKREQQEIARMNYEASRGSNEITRQDNEETRISKENTRISNENTRISNESQRLGNDSARETRLRSVETKVSNFDSRMGQAGTEQAIENRVGSLETKTNSLSSRTSTLEGNVQTLDDTVDGLGRDTENRFGDVENFVGYSTTVDSIFKKVYPIGSIYMSVNSTSPSTLFGGSWTQLKNQFLVGAGGTYSVKSGGGTTSHSHGAGTLGAGATYNSNPATIIIETKQSQEINYNPTAKMSVSSKSDYSQTTDWIVPVHGSTASENHLPPYYAVYMWRRDA